MNLGKHLEERSRTKQIVRPLYQCWIKWKWISKDSGLEISTPVEKDQSASLKDNLPVLADKLDNLQNFFLAEISDVKVEIKNKSLQKTIKENSIDSDRKIELLEKQTNFLINWSIFY